MLKLISKIYYIYSYKFIFLSNIRYTFDISKLLSTIDSFKFTVLFFHFIIIIYSDSIYTIVYIKYYMHYFNNLRIQMFYIKMRLTPAEKST